MTDALYIRPLTNADFPAAAALVAQVFGRKNPTHEASLREHWLEHRPRHPYDKLDNYRAAFDDESLVALARVEQRVLHYGDAKLRVAGIADVCTHPAHRGEGIAARVMQDTLAYAAEQGAHLALLRAIPHYYDRFGFSPVWPLYMLEAPAVKARQLPAPLDIQTAQVNDIPALAALYDKHWRSRVTFHRSPKLWRWMLAAAHQPPTIVLDDGHIAGYLWHHRWLAGRVEVVADTPEALSTLFNVAGDRAARLRRERVTWALPPDDVIVPYAQQVIPVTLSARYSPSGNWMGRIIDFTHLIDTLRPEIASHVQALHPQFNMDALQLAVESDGVVISMADRQNVRCHLSLPDFIQVLFGSLRPVTLAVRESLSSQSVRLLEMLFPARVASIAAWDWF